jgi:hypothetical protein
MGMSYSLTIDLTPEQLQAFGQTGSQIAVAKSAAAKPQIVWQSLRPIEELTMTWEENYGIYATQTQMKAGAKIVSTARVSGNAVNGEEYALVPDGYFVPQENPGDPSAYYARNMFTPENVPMGFGLTQTATLGTGTTLPPNPVSYALVLPGSKAEMTPFTTLYVWVQSLVQGGSVVTEVTGQQLAVPFGAGVDTHNLIYANGRFEFKDTKDAKTFQVETFEPAFF